MTFRFRWFLILCAAIFLATAAWMRLHSPAPETSPPLAAGHEASRVPPPSTNSPPRLPSLGATPRVRTVGTRARDSASGAPGENRLVEFEVVNGLAIAYGDVILGKVEEGSDVTRGHYEISPPQLWDRPEIPYLIHPELPDPQRVERALQYLGQHSPVSFIPRTLQEDAIVFEPGDEHCFSALGRTGGMQPIRLSRGCQPQEIMHEIMHALGFVHEQSRPDRDQFIQVLWDNIEEMYRPQFAIVPESLTEAARGTPFDFRSIMLYRPDTFAASPGLQTLRALGDTPIDPVRDGLSDGDIARLKRLFRL